MKAKNLAEWRQLILDRDSYTCQRCCSTEDVEAHHIKQKSLYPELVLELDNGIVLCQLCHKCNPVKINAFKKSQAGVRWFPGEHSEHRGKRKLIRVGDSRAVIIPADWLKYHEDKTGRTIKAVLLEVNNVIILTVEETEQDDSQESI